MGSGPARDPELTRILLVELERHLVVLEAARAAAGEAGFDPARRTVHALKGSAGLADEPELAAAMQRLERRLREEDRAALDDAALAVRRAIERLSAGASAAATSWPVPPPDLLPTPLDPSLRPHYLSEVGERLAGIDAALLASASDPMGAAAEVYRHVHTIKGAASAAADEPMAWFCHGLEERLRAGAEGAPAALAAMFEELAAHRAVLGVLVEDPDAALATLRGLPAPKRTRSSPSLRAPSVAGLERGAGAEEDPYRDAPIRVSAQSIDRLFDHASGIALARERVAARVLGAVEQARALRRLRTDLAEALRLIGPPRPWGAPAAALQKIERASGALGRIGGDLEAAADRLKMSDQALKEDVGAAKRILTTMRQAPIRGMFSRLSAAAHGEARRTGRVVSIQTSGAEELVDRRLAEALVEPCLQLTRNAIAHGIEPPEARAALGKPREATLSFSATRSGNRLSIAIADDGAGVDVAAVRARAVETGVVTETLAEAADDQTLLELLFLPGFSMRGQSPDLLAGRGIGLDITLAAVQRLGGSIRLSSRQGLGLEARVDVPIDSGLATVLWVEAEGVELAVPAANARRVRRAEDGRDPERVPHLAACLELRQVDRAPFVLELDGVDAAGAFGVGISAVGALEEVLVRRLSPLLWGIGPYAGAIVRGDGTIRLALDVHALAPRARALGRVAEGRASEPPPRPG